MWAGSEGLTVGDWGFELEASLAGAASGPSVFAWAFRLPRFAFCRGGHVAHRGRLLNALAGLALGGRHGVGCRLLLLGRVAIAILAVRGIRLTGLVARVVSLVFGSRGSGLRRITAAAGGPAASLLPPLAAVSEFEPEVLAASPVDGLSDELSDGLSPLCWLLSASCAGILGSSLGAEASVAGADCCTFSPGSPWVGVTVSAAGCSCLEVSASWFSP